MSKQRVIRLCREGVCIDLKRSSIHTLELTPEEARLMASELMQAAADIEELDLVEQQEQMA